jgi:hypothetical protein
MELLIPGLIIVALMVYVSTRIKKTAASAYDSEVVETEEFSIVKPEGFIVIESDDRNVVFAAYSKEYGTGDADAVRQVSVELRVQNDRSIDDVRGSIVESGDEIVDERHLADGTVDLETLTVSEGYTIENDHQLNARNGKVFVLHLAALSETKPDNQKKIDEMLASFELK